MNKTYLIEKTKLEDGFEYSVVSEKYWNQNNFISEEGIEDKNVLEIMESHADDHYGDATFFSSSDISETLIREFNNAGYELRFTTSSLMPSYI